MRIIILLLTEECTYVCPLVCSHIYKYKAHRSELIIRFCLNINISTSHHSTHYYADTDVHVFETVVHKMCAATQNLDDRMTSHITALTHMHMLLIFDRLNKYINTSKPDNSLSVFMN